MKSRSFVVVSAVAAGAVCASAQVPVQVVLSPSSADPSGQFGTIEFDGQGFAVSNVFPLFFSFTTDDLTVPVTISDPAGDTSNDQVLAIYNASTGTMSVPVREGVTTFAPDAALTIGVSIPTINDLGQLAFSGTPTDLGSADPSDLTPRVVVATPDGMGGYTFVSVIRELDAIEVDVDGSLVTGLIGEPDTTTSYDLTRVDNDGEVAFFDDAFASDSPVETDDAVFANVTLDNAIPDPFDPNFNLFQDLTIIGREDASDIVDITTGSPRQVDSIFEYRINADGSEWIYDGNVADPSESDDVIVVSGVVVAQEGEVYNAAAQLAAGLPDTDTVSGVDDPEMNASGAYAFLCVFNSVSGDWVALDANDGSTPRLVVREGQPISPFLPGETWSSISDIQLNARGDLVIIGSTSNPDSGADSVIVFNNYLVIAREGTPVEIDPNDPLDIGFLDSMNASGDIANIAYSYVLRNTLQDANGDSIADGNASSLLRVDFDPADIDSSGIVDFVDVVKNLDVTEAQGFDYNFDGTADSSDFTDFLGDL